MTTQIHQSKFDNLTEKEKELVRKLGITITASNDPFAGKSCVQSYITLVETTCKLCKSTSVIPFSMEGVGTMLHSRQIPFSEITHDSKVMSRQERTNVCPQCRKQLSLFSKEELIEVAINIMKGTH